MPIVLRIGPYRSFFYACDREELGRIHVEQDINGANFWLDPGRLADSGGFRRNEIGRIQRLVEGHQRLEFPSYV